ncbi:MAG: 1-deoxy-D-xylulose-5-phosphate reductoisomerase [Peptococcaceae bacterium]|nr:1-deoxy-D-xylulose-5-phosphate reductoisomerase [Peptococcaceae bacterium]
MASRGIAVLGSTGNIGRQTLQVVRHLGLSVEALTGFNNIQILSRQVSEFEPRLAVVASAQKAMELKKLLQEEGSWMPEIMYGAEGFKLAATMGTAGTIVVAIGGVTGLEPVLAAAKAGKRIALANKESLVVGGQLVCALAEAHGAAIYPVDSEHSAIFQCLGGRTVSSASTAKGAAAESARQMGAMVRRLILTASGGPFRGYTKEQLAAVGPGEALTHPTWTMGKKVTVDSATLMNKGLEVIEAHWLFQVPAPRIQVVVHPQSIIHSMVEFVDGAVIAQMGMPDMRLPIQTALTWPRRMKSCGEYLNLAQRNELTFEEPDHENFPCLKLAYDALSAGGSMPALMNGANEGAVEAFLAGKLRFVDIPDKIQQAMEAHQLIEKPKLDDLYRACEEGRNAVAKK